MKLSPRDVPGFLKRPDPAVRGILIFGADAMRVALKRQDLVPALIGPDGEADMRLTRLAAADLRKDGALLSDALRAQGFFPGPRAVLVEGAGDAQAPALNAALAELTPQDAVLVVTAGQLTARSALRKGFEGSRIAVTIPVYSDPATREEIEAVLARAGITDMGPAAMTDLTALGRSLDPGDFRQFVEKLALYTLDGDGPVSAEDVAACAPASTEVAEDAVLHSAAEGEVETLGGLLARLAGQGANPTGLCISAQRHFRQLHAAATHPQGPDVGLTRARPPVFGPRKDRMLRQARHWGPMRLESVLSVILETDLALRSARPLPPMALVERMFIRIAMLHNR